MANIFGKKPTAVLPARVDGTPGVAPEGQLPPELAAMLLNRSQEQKTIGQEDVRKAAEILRTYKDGKAELLFTDDTVGQGRKGRRALIPHIKNIRVVVDTSILEIFVNNGGWVFSTRYFDEADELTISSTFAAESAVWYPMDTVNVNYLVER